MKKAYSYFEAKNESRVPTLKSESVQVAPKSESNKSEKSSIDLSEELDQLLSDKEATIVDALNAIAMIIGREAGFAETKAAEKVWNTAKATIEKMSSKLADQFDDGGW